MTFGSKYQHAGAAPATSTRMARIGLKGTAEVVWPHDYQSQENGINVEVDHFEYRIVTG
jgi:hypothetical protein